MARKTDKDRVKEWNSRISAANKINEKWEEEYRCDELWKYYLGHQWKGQYAPGKEPYTINLVFSSIAIQMPTLLFYHPRVNVKSRPAKFDDDPQGAGMRAQLREDTLNTFIRNPIVRFKEETQLALLESDFRFGVVEIGYSADFSDNPNTPTKPIIDEDSQQEAGTLPAKSKIIKNESLFVKRIPAKQFRVSINAKNSLEQADWCGYFEWMYPADIKANPRYKNTSTIKSSGKISNDLYAAPATEGEEEKEKYRNQLKVWKIWDLRAKKRYIFQDGGEKFFLEEDMDTMRDGRAILPLEAYKQFERLDEFLPLPPVYNWLSPQNELNETREMQKIHRQRFRRAYECTNAVDDGELRKFEEPVDGRIIKVPSIGSIAPIADAPLGPDVSAAYPLSKEDFREISGVSAEQRGLAESDTATQANIINANSQIRESFSKVGVADWLARIAYKMMLILEKRMSLPFWVKLNADQYEQNYQADIVETGNTWKKITTEDLGDSMNYDVSVDVDSLSPSTDAGERQSWTQVLMVLANPQILPVLLASDLILRKTLSYYGIKNEKEIEALKELGMTLLKQMAAAAAQQMQMQQQAMAIKHPVGAIAQGAGPGPTPGMGDIQGQIAMQPQGNPLQ